MIPWKSLIIYRFLIVWEINDMETGRDLGPQLEEKSNREDHVPTAKDLVKYPNTILRVDRVKSVFN